MKTSSPTLAHQLRRHRIEVLRLSPADLALLLRTTAAHVRRVESGTVEPPAWYVNTQVAIERALIVALKEAV